MVDVDSYARTDGPAIFLEITERDDLGENLIAPQEDQGGGNRYWLVTQPTPGDIVLHYHRPSGGIIAISRVAGPPEESTIRWAAKGTASREQHVEPYERPAWLVPLTGYQVLDPPTTQEEVVARRDQILQVKQDLENEHGTGLQFPYNRYRDGLRTLQAYLALYPRDLLDVFPELASQVSDYEALDPSEIQPPESDPEDPDLFLADEDIAVNHSGQVTIDPDALTRANQSHAAAQNKLRQRVIDRGGKLSKPIDGANVDLAWADKRGRTTVAEVKSLTATNEAHQIRYGIGQLIDYLHEYEQAGIQDAIGVLFLARPPARQCWVAKSDWVGIELCWPGKWPSTT